MKNKKVLMWMAESSLKPAGGPTGYLYNISKYNETLKDKFIEFLPSAEHKKSLKGTIFHFLLTRIKIIKFYSYYSHIFKDKKLAEDLDINSYDYIHFHDTISLFQFRKNFYNYNGKIILTSHCPKPVHREVTEDVFINLNPKQKEKLKNRLELIEEHSFITADYVLFPCKEAKDPYLTWDFFKKINNTQIKEKLIYCPTGIPEIKVKINKENFRQTYNIPKSAFVISYVGRHNEIKGYNKLKEFATELLKNNTDIYFIIAGKEFPLQGLSHDRWIEVGYTKDPHSLINSSDIFILPNQQTYFDLIMLEALSLGIPVITTPTGGNKFFKQFSTSGILFYKSQEECIELIKNLKSDQKQLVELGKNNYELFRKHFTIKTFMEEYFSLIQKLN